MSPARAAQRDRDRGTARQRVRAAMVAAASWTACRLPQRLLLSLAELAGTLRYHLMSGRAALVRANLRQVATWMLDQDTGDPVARRAAGDDDALERLVHSAFRHHARYYLEVARTPGVTPRYLAERAAPDEPAILDAAFEGGGRARLRGSALRSPRDARPLRGATVRPAVRRPDLQRNRPSAATGRAHIADGARD